jgi:hypothetical protein
MEDNIIMADIKRKIKNKLNDAENKAHELKGRAEQKQKDMKKEY